MCSVDNKIERVCVPALPNRTRACSNLSGMRSLLYIFVIYPPKNIAFVGQMLHHRRIFSRPQGVIHQCRDMAAIVETPEATQPEAVEVPAETTNDKPAQAEAENPIPQLGFELRNPFSQQEIKAETDLEGCRVSAQCSIGMLELAENDILLWGSNLATAAKCHFFVEKDSQLFLYATEGILTKTTEALRKFQFRGPKMMKLWSELHAPTIPTWIRNGPEDFVHCLI